VGPASGEVRRQAACEVTVHLPRLDQNEADENAWKGCSNLNLRRQNQPDDVRFPLGHATQEKSYWSAQLSSILLKLRCRGYSLGLKQFK
jgi:hypothetical protein